MKKQDKKVLELREKLLKKENSLLKSEKPVYITSGQFRPSPYSDKGMINVKTAGMGSIIQATESIVTKRSALFLLGLDKNEEHLGYSTEAWVEDFKTRVAVIKRSATLEEVKALKEEIDANLLSTSQKRGIMLESITDKFEKI